ncbi:MAG: 2-dehydropantoate 2-reductase, partial [Chloroflexi bacterium]|nr:2-dehydropantoate 2-reductase [Chloroflexota bacterium]
MSTINLLVFGAGAIGTYIGGSLALRGHRLVFLEQPEVAARLQESGLALQLGAQAHHILPSAKLSFAASLPQALQQGPFDAAIFALKSFDAPSAIAAWTGFEAAMPPVLCLQNGVENEAAIAAALGADRVIPGTVTSAVGRRAAGDVHLERLRGMGVAAGHPFAAALTAALDDADLRARLFSSADSMKWSKLLTNLLANASSAILDMTPAEIFAHPALFRLEMAQIREAVQVMRARRIPVVDLPGVPVRALALAARLPAAIARPLMQRSVGKGRGGKMPSFHIDLHSGRGQSEVDYLNGAVARFGASVNIPTPVNRLLNETLLTLT